MKKTILLISLVILSVVVFTVVSCSDTDGEKKKKQVHSVIELSESMEPVGIVEQPVDSVVEPVVAETSERPSDIKPSYTFWYVSYDVHIASRDSRYNGYTVIILETQYFDIERAIKLLEPNYVKNDYVGIHFFQQVPIETYKAFQKANL